MSEAAVLAEMYTLITANKREMFDRIAANRTRHLTVVLENIYQDHNASAVLRSCDCFGIQDLYLIEKNNRFEVKRDIALGAGRWVDQFHFDQQPNPEVDCINELKSKGYKIVVTSPHSHDQSLNELDLSQPIALVFGTERRGISETMHALADEFVRIPMYGFTESFNISVAAALTMNVLREKLEQSSLSWKINSDEQIQLKLAWCRKILTGGYALESEIRNRLFQKE